MKVLYTFLSLLSLVSVSFGQQVGTLHAEPTQLFRDALVLDAEGNLYCADYSGTAVYRRTPTGVVTVFATGFNTPNGLAFDSQHHLYVVDNTANKIFKLSAQGAFLDTIAATNPSGIIKTLHSDTMIVTLYGGNALLKLSPNGTLSTWHQGAPLNGPVGLAYDALGQLYTANFENRRIYRVTEDSLHYIATVPGPGSGNQWLGFIAYANGALWGTSFNYHRIYRVGLEPGYPVTLAAGSSAGSVDGPALSARFNQPNGICASVTGDTLFISDYGTGRLRILTDFQVSLQEFDAAPLPFQLAPNPSEGAIRFATATPLHDAHLQIADLQGQIVYEAAHIDALPSEIDLGSLASGCYVVRLSQAGQSSQQKLIKY